MDEKTTLMKALAAGAVVSFGPNLLLKVGAQETITEAYAALKALIRARYSQVDADLLDIGPGSAERQQTIEQQLEAAGATADAEVLDRARALLALVEAADPEALWATQVAAPAPQHK